MTTRFGDFQAPNFNSVGDKYVDREKLDERQQGLAFKAAVSRKGKTNDATFDRFKALSEGEKYIDPSRQQLLALKEKRKGAVTDTAFKGPSPMKDSCGAGDFYGTLGGKLEYIAACFCSHDTTKQNSQAVPCCPAGSCADHASWKHHTACTLQPCANQNLWHSITGRPHVQGSPETKLKKGDVQHAQRNIHTNAGKKGGYGFNKTTLSERQGPAGVCGEYAYVPEPADAAQKDSAAEKAAAKNVSESAFRPSNPSKKGTYGYAKTNIGNKAQGVAGEFGYVTQGGASADATSSSKAAGGEADAAARAPFVPSRVARKGYNCTLTKFPEYYADPDQIKADARRQAKKLELEALAGGVAFRPAHIPRAAATRSIVRMNI